MYMQECIGRKGMVAGSIYLRLSHGMPWKYLNADEVESLDFLYGDSWRAEFLVEKDFKGVQKKG